MIYLFGPPDDPQRFQLDETSGLSQGNQRIRVDATALKILLALVRDPGRRFSSRALVDKVRPNYSIDEQSFGKTYVKRLRAALNDRTAIVNERNIGYSFVWEVKVQDKSLAHSELQAPLLVQKQGIPDSVPAFEMYFNPDITPEQIKGILTAMSDYFRACGGAGLRIELEPQLAHTLERVDA